MTITDRFEKTMDFENGKQSRDPQFARTLSTIDELKRQGILSPTRYTLPMTDTIGRRFSQTQFSEADNVKRFPAE